MSKCERCRELECVIADLKKQSIEDIERAVDVAIEKALMPCPDDYCVEDMSNLSCVVCIKTRTMEELNK